MTNIKLITTPHCPLCEKARRIMKEKNIEYDLHLATAEDELVIELQAKGHKLRNAPIIVDESGNVYQYNNAISFLQTL